MAEHAMTYTYGATNTAIANLTIRVAMLTKELEDNKNELQEIRKVVKLEKKKPNQQPVLDEWVRIGILRIEAAKAAQYREKHFPHETAEFRTRRLETATRELDSYIKKSPLKEPTK